jgi:hypothetical protein
VGCPLQSLNFEAKQVYYGVILISVAKLGMSKKIIGLLAIIALLGFAAPMSLWYISLPKEGYPVQPTPSPAATPTPSPTPSASELTSPPASPSSSPSFSQGPIQPPHASSSPAVSPTPSSLFSPQPLPTGPPMGSGPSVTEELAQEASIQELLEGMDLSEKAAFQTFSNATLGYWSTYVTCAPLTWNPGSRVRLGVALHMSNDLLAEFRARYSRIDNVCVLVTAERDFDAQGCQHVPWDNTVSTILTPSGLPIEGGGSAAISRFNGYSKRTPVDIMMELPLADFVTENDWTNGAIYGSFDMPNNLPPGIYRLRLDFGLKIGSKYLDFNNNTIGVRPTNLNSISCLYSQPIYASGWDTNAVWVEGSQIKRKPYWALLWDYNSNGYRGVVALEDQNKVAISPRSIIHDAVILPKVNVNGALISYNIEPNFLLDNDNTQRNIPMDYSTGQWSARITLPNGTITNLGSANFRAKRGNGATTQNSNFTSWKPPIYGNYTLEGKGWIRDIWGNTYEGGGNYTFWIGQRLTVATATFQGMPYNVGNRYGRDLAFNPPVPANVTITARLFSNSDPRNSTTVVSTGIATAGGIFGAAQGMLVLPLNAPGEYHATVTATYVDTQKILWVASMTHAGVVYPLNSSIEAHGKKLSVSGGQLVDRGQTKAEGYVEPSGATHLQHINFPYNFGDALLIASEHQGANKIEPVLTYKAAGSNSTYSSTLQTVGRTNLIINTSNGLSPEMYPEYITDKPYFYAAAAQPGFNCRFIVAHDNTRAPYWPTSNTNFGGQYGASNNGDFPGTIYRLLGGVILNQKGQTPAYAGYQASAFILPGKTNNNRVIGPGEEDLPSPDGVPARFFLVPIRPGSAFQVGALFGAVLQIDPIVPCNVTFTLTAPDNTNRIAKGQGDQYGYFAASEKWVLDQPGVWTFKVNATWNNHQGKVPGLPDSGGWIYVIENGSMIGPGLNLNMPTQQTFSPAEGLNVTGQTTASEVYFAAIIPGAVLEQGVLPAVNGSFRYSFDPQRMASLIQTYDVINLVNGKQEIGRVVHLTFFSREQLSNGTQYHSFVRVVLRGTTAIYVGR